VIVAIDAITENGNAMKYTNAQYMRAVDYQGAINDVIMRAEVADFWKYVATTGTDKHLRDCMSVFTGLIVYDDNESIANAYGLSIDVVKKRRADLKKHYEDWKKVGGGLNYASDYNPMQGTTTVSDFATASSLTYKRIIEKADGKYEVVPKFYADVNRVNLTTKPFLRHKKAESRKNARVSAVYNHSAYGIINHENRATIDGERLWSVCTADNADYTDVYANVLGENIGINAVYDDNGQWIGVDWYVCGKVNDSEPVTTELCADDKRENVRYGENSRVEMVKNGENIDVFYVWDTEIQGKKAVSRHYEHSIAVK
jgi:hypothetical protein